MAEMNADDQNGSESDDHHQEEEEEEVEEEEEEEEDVRIDGGKAAEIDKEENRFSDHESERDSGINGHTEYNQIETLTQNRTGQKRKYLSSLNKTARPQVSNDDDVCGDKGSATRRKKQKGSKSKRKDTARDPKSSSSVLESTVSRKSTSLLTALDDLSDAPLPSFRDPNFFLSATQSQQRQREDHFLAVDSGNAQVYEGNIE